VFGNTIAEFFGQILIGFTRSVAEHDSFDETESHSELLGCYAIDDTGKELLKRLFTKNTTKVKQLPRII